MKNLVKIFKALGDETRLRIVELLLDGEKCVCEIVRYVKRTQSTVSIQLAKLESMGILKARREGKKVYYSIADARVKKILAKADFSKWFGVERKKINWYPVIDEGKCTGCGMCTAICGRDVFEYDSESGKSKVKNPYNCMVGCDNCSIYCPTDAISFPQKNRREFIQSLIKKYGIVKRVRQTLEVQGR